MFLPSLLYLKLKTNIKNRTENNLTFLCFFQLVPVLFFSTLFGTPPLTSDVFGSVTPEFKLAFPPAEQSAQSQEVRINSVMHTDPASVKAEIFNGRSQVDLMPTNTRLPLSFQANTQTDKTSSLQMESISTKSQPAKMYVFKATYYT